MPDEGCILDRRWDSMLHSVFNLKQIRCPSFPIKPQQSAEYEVSSSNTMADSPCAM